MLAASAHVAALANSPDEADRALLETIWQAMGVIRSADLDEIAFLADADEDSLIGLIEPERRVGASIPTDTYAFAALATAAVQLIEGPESDVRPLIRKLTYTRVPGFVPRGAGHGPGSPDELVGRWGSPNDAFRRRILRAVDPDLKAQARVAFRAGLEEAELSAEARRSANTRKDGLSLPRVLWPAWSSPLHVGLGVNLDVIRETFAELLVGDGPTSLRPTMLGTPEETTIIVHALGRLAERLTADGTQIDYGRRINLPWSALLKERDWFAILQASGSSYGSHRTVAQARIYMHMRLTGGTLRNAEAALGIPHSRNTAHEQTVFVLALTLELQAGIDAYLTAFKDSAHPDASAEPIVWTPGRNEEDRKWRVGPELDAIPSSALHSAVRSYRGRVSAIARSFGVTESHIKLAFDADPPSNGEDDVEDLDWSHSFLQN